MRLHYPVCQDCRWVGPEHPENKIGSSDLVKVCPNCESDDVDYFSRSADNETLDGPQS